MSKHGPTEAQEVREYADALARALGKFSDEQWAIDPWFMEIVIVARKLADQLASGALDDQVKAIYESPTLPAGDIISPWAPGAWIQPKATP